MRLAIEAAVMEGVRPRSRSRLVSALGGIMGEAIDSSAFPVTRMDMVIDYVRVYEL